MTDTTKFKNVSLSKKTYSDVGLLSKEIFDVQLSLSKTIEYLIEICFEYSIDWCGFPVILRATEFN